MLETNERKIPVIYHLDDYDVTLEIARDYFTRRGVVYKEVHSMYEAYKATGDRMPTLILISTALNDPHGYMNRQCYPSISVLRQTRPGINMVTIAKDYRQDDQIDSQREGALELVEFSLEGLERVMEIASRIVENGGPSGLEKEIVREENRVHAGSANLESRDSLLDMQEMRGMIYSAVREVFEDVVRGRTRPTPPPSIDQQMTAYQYH
jgi:DNA-binding NtrC family response regulator